MKILRYLAIVVGILIVALIAIPFFLSPNQSVPRLRKNLARHWGVRSPLEHEPVSLYGGVGSGRPCYCR